MIEFLSGCKDLHEQMSLFKISKSIK